MLTASLIEAWNRTRSDLLARYPDIDAETLSDTLEGELGAKDAAAQLIRDALEDEAQAEGLKAYLTALSSRLGRLSDRATARRKAAFDLLQELGEKRLERPEFTASIANGRQSVVITDPAKLPEAMRSTLIIPDKKAIREALDAKTEVPGAILGNGAPYLRVASR